MPQPQRQTGSGVRNSFVSPDMFRALPLRGMCFALAARYATFADGGAAGAHGLLILNDGRGIMAGVAWRCTA